MDGDVTAPPPTDDPTGDSRLDELLAINARLAAEIRNLTAGHRVGPSTGSSPAARHVASLIGERDALAERLAEAQAEAERLRGELAGARAERDRLALHAEQLQRHYDEAASEVTRLRGGAAGLLRRFLARLRLR